MSIDTLRSDHLTVYGYPFGATPAIDALRRDAMLFESAWSPVPLTVPSHLSAFTGLLPPHHGVRDNGGFVLPADIPTLAERLRAAHYDTAAFVSAGVLAPGSGVERGFEVFDVPGEGGIGAYAERPGAATVEAAKRWLATGSSAARPFFLFVHLYEPHAPYRPQPPFAEAFGERPYDGEIATADAAVGELVAALRSAGRYDGASIVLFSDHGEGLGDHGETGHGVLLHREALQVPLLLKLPRSEAAGATIATPVDLTDLAPTALALAGLSPGVPTDGFDLLRPAGASPSRMLYAETYYPRLHYGWSELTSAIVDGWHLIDGPTPELFDQRRDRNERRSLASTERRRLATLRERLAALRRPLTDGGGGDTDPEVARRLVALGYLAGGGAAEGPLPDPRTRLAVLAQLDQAKALVAEGRYREATAIVRPAALANPQAIDLWLFLAFSQERWDRPESTLASFRRAFELSRGAAPYALYMARQLLRMNRLDEARRHLELILERQPGQRDAHELGAVIALLEHRLDDAWASALRAERATPSFRRDLTAALSRAGRTADAERAARELQPLLPDPGLPDRGPSRSASDTTRG